MLRPGKKDEQKLSSYEELLEQEAAEEALAEEAREMAEEAKGEARRKYGE